jgi:C1A family cysteine protease
MTAKKRTYDWHPQVADMRDATYGIVKPTGLPKYVNKLGAGNPIQDQGQLGSCTGNSSTSALEISTNRMTPLSRLMAYYNARDMEKTVEHDAGAQIRDVIKCLMTLGVSNEELWPYDVKKFKAKPSAAAYKDAKIFLKSLAAFEYVRVTNLDQLKHALRDGYPVTFGFSVPEKFEKMKAPFFLGLTTKSDKMIGGHAVVAVGYDDRPAKPFVWVRNSWGESWGLNGYFKMDQAWFAHAERLVDDMWVIRPKADGVKIKKLARALGK